MRSPCSRARSTKPSTRSTWSGWIIGAIVVAGSRLSPSTWRSTAGWKRSRNSSRDRRLDQEPGAGEAHLTRVVVLAGCLRGSGIEIGVGEHDQRPLPAQFGGERHDVLGGRAADDPGGLRRAGEADPLDPRVTDERRADLLADALHEVEHARREPGLDRQVGEQRARQRRPLGRLEDHGVAGGQRRGDLPRGEHERGVPRRDHDRRPGRHAHDGVARALRGPLPLLVRHGEVGVQTEVLGAAGDQAGAHRLVQHAHVDRLDGGDLLGVGDDQVGEAMEQLSAPTGSQVGPRPEGDDRCGHRGEGRAGVAASDVGELPRPVERGAILERLRRPDALAADEVALVDFHALDERHHAITAFPRRPRRSRRGGSCVVRSRR